MQLSKYNILIEDFPKLSFTLAYNLITKQYICLKSKLYSQLNEKNEYLFSLIEKGFVVENEEQEDQNVTNLIIEKCNENTLRLTVLLTRNCNCSCVYCYQDSSKKRDLTANEMDEIYHFANRYMSENFLKNLEVIYFGGEPLLQKDLITSSSKKWYKRYKENFEFSIITNGTLLSKDDVIVWKNHNLRSLKITLDGVPQIHNSRRKYKSGKGTFDDIVCNIKKIHNLVEVIINIVLDSENSISAYQLIDWIKSSKLNVSTCINLTRVEGKNISLVDSKELVRLARYIKKQAIYQYSSIGNPDGEICSYKKEHSFTIDSDLSFYSCNSEVDKSHRKLDDTLKKNIIYKTKQINGRCRICKYLPICFGGCLSEKQCKKSYYENTIPELVKIYSGLNEI